MAKQSLLLLVLSLFALASSFGHAFLLPSRLIAVKNLSQQAALDLIDRYAVVGYYGGLVLVAGDDESLRRLQEDDGYPWAELLDAHYDAGRESRVRYLVLEKQRLAQDADDAVDRWLEKVTSLVASSSSQQQQVLSGPLSMLWYCDTGRVILKMDASVADQLPSLLPHDSDVTMLARRPLRRNTWKRTEILRNQRAGLKRRADIQDLVDQVSSDHLYEFATWLTGENGSSEMYTRNSYSINTENGVMEAAEYIANRFTEYGFNVSYFDFRSDMGPNVIATLRGSVYPDTYVILGAHYDSREASSTSPTNRAPGANDDGSGTTGLLEMAKLISENRVSFAYSLIFGAWCGEEQGLIGSAAYADYCVDEDLDIIAMLQSDMIAYRATGEAAQCAFPDRYHTPELTDLVMDITRTYVPQVEVCYTSACCSDHMSFWQNGYSATQLFERCGSIADPQYHRSGDLVERTGYDIEEQFVYNVRANFAAALTIAEAL